MNIEKLLSPESRAMLARRREDILNCYALSNTALAQRLLDLSKEARAESPDLDLTVMTYDSAMFVCMIPELARRLGLVVPGAAESELVKLSAAEFREYVGVFLRNISRYHRGYAWQYLTNEAINGNPVVMAIDRICPGDVESKTDYLVVSMKSVAASRGKPFNGVWTPAVLQK